MLVRIRFEGDGDGIVSPIDRDLVLNRELHLDCKGDEREMGSFPGDHPSVSVPLVYDVRCCPISRFHRDDNVYFPATESGFMRFCDDFVVPGIELLVEGLLFVVYPFAVTRLRGCCCDLRLWPKVAQF